MNVQVTPAALEEINVLRATGYRGAGFLLGTTCGRFVLIEKLLAVDFDRMNGSSIYENICRAYRSRLQGVFFCRKPAFALDWFLHDLVLEIRRGQIGIQCCEFSAARQKAVLVPLMEDKEGIWPV